MGTVRKIEIHSRNSANQVASRKKRQSLRAVILVGPRQRFTYTFTPHTTEPEKKVIASYLNKGEGEGKFRENFALVEYRQA